ncbi:MAG: sulfurtransferase TusA family protein [bacterium]|nr:sulfurtransferase TusA family protein [bacterium]
MDDACLDLRTWRCPLSWAKARVWLETRRRGEEVVILLGDAKSAHDLPRAAEAHGHHVIGVVRDGGGFRVVIEV